MKKIHIYSDESRHKNERFLLLGGIWIEENKIEIILKNIQELRKKNGFINSNNILIPFSGELKWTKVSDKYLHVYKELVDLFFKWINKDLMRSCIMLVDSKDPYVLQHSNIQNEGYFKLLYQLYFHNSKIPAIYKIFPDRITNPEQRNVNFTVLKNCLEAAFKKKFENKLNPQYKNNYCNLINNITPVDSKLTQLIQVIDVIMGGIGYFENRLFEKDNARKSKVDLMKYIFDKMLYSGKMLTKGKKFMEVKSTKFNIWRFRPKNKKSSS